jgi:hypothetical protein
MGRDPTGTPFSPPRKPLRPSGGPLRSLSFPEAGRYLNAPRVHAEVLAQNARPGRAFAAADKYNVADLDERQACTLVGADRTMIRYRSRRSPDTELRARLLPRSPCASGHDYEVSWRWQPAADLGNCERYVEWTWDAEGHDRLALLKSRIDGLPHLQSPIGGVCTMCAPSSQRAVRWSWPESCR